MIYTIFDKKTGRLKSRSMSPSEDLPETTDIVVNGFFEPNRHYIDPVTFDILDAGEHEEFYIQDGINGWVFDSISADLTYKSMRNSLLKECDWVELPSAQSRSNIKDWLDYRQCLRDIPQQTNYPKQIIWPTKPEE